jgi:hypothetical protein
MLLSFDAALAQESSDLLRSDTRTAGLYSPRQKKNLRLSTPHGTIPIKFQEAQMRSFPKDTSPVVAMPRSSRAKMLGAMSNISNEEIAQNRLSFTVTVEKRLVNGEMSMVGRISRDNWRLPTQPAEEFTDMEKFCSAVKTCVDEAKQALE